MGEEKYYKCLVPDCKSRFVYDYFPTLVLHYRSEHVGTALPSTEASSGKEIPEGFQLYIPKRKARQTAQASASTGDTSAPTKPGNVYREAPEPSIILNKILDEYPGLKEGIIQEVMSWVQLKGTLHPMEVRHLLTQMDGVPKGAPDIISQKYSLALAKAAQDGEAEVQMALASWGGQGIFQPGGPVKQPFMPLGGMMGAGQGFNPMFPFGFNPNAFGWAGYPQWSGQPTTEGKDKTESAADVERNKRFDELENENRSLAESVQALISKMEQTEQEKREAALNARIDKIETLILELGQHPKTDEQKDKALETITEELKSTRTEIGKIREEAAQNRVASLEKEMAGLRELLKGQSDERLKKLEADLAEAKAEAKKPVTGSTEMDVVRDLGKDVIGTVKEAGKDIKSVVLSRQAAETFRPDRTPLKERAKAGEKIAEAVEQEAELTAKEQAYVAKK